MRIQLIPGPSLFHCPAKKVGLGTRLMHSMLVLIYMKKKHFFEVKKCRLKKSKLTRIGMKGVNFCFVYPSNNPYIYIHYCTISETTHSLQLLKCDVYVGIVGWIYSASSLVCQLLQFLTNDEIFYCRGRIIDYMQLIFCMYVYPSFLSMCVNF